MLSILLVLAGLACVKQAVDYEREYAKQLAPKKLEVSSTSSSGPMRKPRVRGHVDSDYRDQVLRWTSTIERQFQRASAMVRGPLGVAFELESMHPWGRRGPEGALDATLAELKALEPGEDVDLVIGFV